MNYIYDAVSERPLDLAQSAPKAEKARDRRGRKADRLTNIFPMAAETESCLLAMADERGRANTGKSHRRIKWNMLAAVVTMALVEHGHAFAQTATTITGDNNTTALTLDTGNSLTITSGATLNVNNGKNTVAVDGSSTIVNDGTLEETGVGGDAGRAIRDKDDPLTLKVENYGTISAADDDAIEIQYADNNAAVYNYGTIIATGSSDQGINFNNVTSGSNYLYNAKGALIETYEADAVRPGVNGIIDNAGKIYSYNPSGNTSSSDGIDAQTNTGVVITNTGIIEGARHGITGGNTSAAVADGSYTMAVTNTGVIQGDDGSGINIDGLNGNELVTVYNSGTITGDGVTRDGDGVDVDGLVDLVNSGTIVSEHADNDASEGVTVGGGTIINSGIIAGYNSATNADGSDNDGLGRGITLAGIDHTSTETFPTPQGIYGDSEVVNSGLIYGQDGGAIAVTGAANDDTVTIINEATGILESGGFRRGGVHRRQ